MDFFFFFFLFIFAFHTELLPPLLCKYTCLFGHREGSDQGTDTTKRQHCRGPVLCTFVFCDGGFFFVVCWLLLLFPFLFDFYLFGFSF